MGGCAQLIGTNASLSHVWEDIEFAGQSDAKVLITGESGVGKEVVARLIHASGGRAHAPLVTINCAGFQDTLLESELFGHARGSFTGAYRDRPGLLEKAHRGTLFMDEVGEMSLRMQALLLRFVESGEVQRVGADDLNLGFDVRIIAATHRDLTSRIAANEFREDLFYRLNVIHIVIPPLRERREDIPLLVSHFLEAFAARCRVPVRRITPGALDILMAYDWPGNVRELRNVIERMLVRVRTSEITPADVPADIRSSTPSAAAADAKTSLPDSLFERMLIQRESFWNVVYEPFMSRDLRRDDVRAIIGRGLERTQGSYKLLTELFNIRPADYKRFLNFLRKHDCHVPFHGFRVMDAVRGARA